MIYFRYDDIIHSCKVRKLTIPLIRCDDEIFKKTIKRGCFDGIDHINDGKLLPKR